MAGLLTLPGLLFLPDNMSVASYKQTLSTRGITAAGTVADSHRIPLHQAASAARLPFPPAKVRKIQLSEDK
jgi:hypothetical protein